MELTLLGFLLLSCSLNGWFFIQQRRQSKKQPLSVDAKQLLHDLTNGGAIVRVTVIDPEGLMVYRGIK